MVAEWPTTVTNSRCPRALVRRTQKPFSGLWKVTRSTRPATASWVGDAATGFMRDVREARWNRGGVAGGGAGVAGRLHPAHRRGARCLPARPPTLANSSPQKPRSGARWLSSRASRRTDRCPTSAHRRHADALHHLFYGISLAHQAIAATVLAPVARSIRCCRQESDQYEKAAYTGLLAGEPAQVRSSLQWPLLSLKDSLVRFSGWGIAPRTGPSVQAPRATWGQNGFQVACGVNFR